MKCCDYGLRSLLPLLFPYRNKLECFLLSVTRTLVYNLEAMLEAYPLSGSDATIWSVIYWRL